MYVKLTRLEENLSLKLRKLKQTARRLNFQTDAKRRDLEFYDRRRREDFKDISSQMAETNAEKDKVLQSSRSAIGNVTDQNYLKRFIQRLKYELPVNTQN